MQQAGVDSPELGRLEERRDRLRDRQLAAGVSERQRRKRRAQCVDDRVAARAIARRAEEHECSVFGAKILAEGADPLLRRQHPLVREIRAREPDGHLTRHLRRARRPPDATGRFGERALTFCARRGLHAEQVADSIVEVELNRDDRLKNTRCDAKPAPPENVVEPEARRGSAPSSAS